MTPSDGYTVTLNINDLGAFAINSGFYECGYKVNDGTINYFVDCTSNSVTLSNVKTIEFLFNEEQSGIDTPPIPARGSLFIGTDMFSNDIASLSVEESKKLNITNDVRYYITVRDEPVLEIE